MRKSLTAAVTMLAVTLGGQQLIAQVDCTAPATQSLSTYSTPVTTRATTYTQLSPVVLAPQTVLLNTGSVSRLSTRRYYTRSVATPRFAGTSVRLPAFSTRVADLSVPVATSASIAAVPTGTLSTQRVRLTIQRTGPVVESRSASVSATSDTTRIQTLCDRLDQLEERIRKLECSERDEVDELLDGLNN